MAEHLEFLSEHIVIEHRPEGWKMTEMGMKRKILKWKGWWWKFLSTATSDRFWGGEYNPLGWVFLLLIPGWIILSHLIEEGVILPIWGTAVAVDSAVSG